MAPGVVGSSPTFHTNGFVAQRQSKALLTPGSGYRNSPKPQLTRDYINCSKPESLSLFGDRPRGNSPGVLLGYKEISFFLKTQLGKKKTIGLMGAATDGR